MEKSITELDLSDSTLMKLWGLGIEKIGELTKRSEKQLRKEIDEFLKGTRQRLAGTDIIREIEERLGHFGLCFTRHKYPNKKDFVLDAKILLLRPATPIDDETAARVLGDQFPLFKQFREGSWQEKLEARNALTVANRLLAAKQAQMKMPKLKRADDPAMDFDDLWQEGVIGLMASIEGFDYTRGWRFSTYATWWVRQAIDRALADRTCMPVYIVENLKKFQQQCARLEQEMGEEPTREDLAQAMNKPVEEIERQLNYFHFLRHFHSLDHTYDSSGEGKAEDITLHNLLSDKNAVSPDEQLIRSELQGAVRRIFEEVPFLEVEQKCVQMYFGIDADRAYTLEEIGLYIGVTRERVRQRIKVVLERLRTQKVWEIVHAHIPTMSAPSFNRPSKSRLELGESVDELMKLRGPVVRDKRQSVQAEPRSDAEKARDATGIINHIATAYGVNSRDLLSFNRAAKLARARQVAMYRLREDMQLSFPEIGEIMSRDHSTVMHGYQKIKTEITEGIIPLGCFPEEPMVTPDPLATRYLEGGKDSRSLDEVLDQEILVLELDPEIVEILRTMRKVTTLRGLHNLGRDRLLMTEGMEEESVQQIEAALRKEGVELA